MQPFATHENYQGWLSIPYLTAMGHCVGFKFRRLDDGKPKYGSPTGQKAHLYNVKDITKAQYGVNNRFTKVIDDFTERDSAYAISHPMVKSSNNPALLAHLVAITTAGVKTDSTGQDSIAFSLYNYGKRVASGEVEDPSFFMAWWEAPAESDHRDPETWKIANPGFGDLSDPQDFESAVRRTPEAEFRTKRCNQWVSSQVSWLPTGTWEACKGEVSIEGKDYVIGFDGSFSGDSTVLVGVTIEETPQVFMIKAW